MKGPHLAGARSSVAGRGEEEDLAARCRCSMHRHESHAAGVSVPPARALARRGSEAVRLAPLARLRREVGTRDLVLEPVEEEKSWARPCFGFAVGAATF